MRRERYTIGAGALIAEIQENSNLTYRLYDYNRVDKNGMKRELKTFMKAQVLHKSPCIQHVYAFCRKKVIGVVITLVELQDIAILEKNVRREAQDFVW